MLATSFHERENGTMSIIHADPAAYVSDLCKQISEKQRKTSEIIVLLNDTEWCLVPTEQIKQMLAEKIASRFMEKPSLLSELHDRLKNETPEDLD